MLEPSRNEIDPQNVHDAVARVLRSAEFSHAKRLREFLEYVVSETLAGRKDAISARTIAQDVYGRGKRGNDSDLSVVRVDAGRLRRRLGEYYANTGQNDPLRIDVPTGSYSPEFTIEHPPEVVAEPAPQRSRRRAASPLAIVALLGVVALTAFLLTDRLKGTDTTSVDMTADSKSAIRRAMLQKSPASLQAANQAEQARDLLFPAIDPVRLGLVLNLLQHAIDLDPSYFGGYAGAAQVSALIASLTPETASRQMLLEQARSYAARAVELRPDSSWVQSAAAWVAFSNRDYSTAKRLSETAIELDPTDLHAGEIDAIISFFTADFQRAATMSDPATHNWEATGRTTNRNVYALAQFYLGNYAETVRQIETAIELGEPISEISVFYIAAALWQLGSHDAARDYVSYYQKAWPKGRIDLLMAQTFISKDLIEEPAALFRKAGGFRP